MQKDKLKHNETCSDQAAGNSGEEETSSSTREGGHLPQPGEVKPKTVIRVTRNQDGGEDRQEEAQNHRKKVHKKVKQKLKF